ncbi:helix-turn-helix domain-containing protein [Desulfopila sp. IMCC35008]|uniref:helix-turn-helix domain-containing protein n=1 Tax=Desulfopila sp. IMCC35008 TaxID=2653858 RepID=UPI0013D552B3
MTLQHREDLKIYNQIKSTACVLFQSQGYDNTTIDDLVDKLNIEAQTFFIYFRSMDELLEVVWSES